MAGRVFQTGHTKEGRKSTSNIHFSSKFVDDAADPSYRCYHSKVVIDIFEYQRENIVLRTIAQ